MAQVFSLIENNKKIDTDLRDQHFIEINISGNDSYTILSGTDLDSIIQPNLYNEFLNNVEIILKNKFIKKIVISLDISGHIDIIEESLKIHYSEPSSWVFNNRTQKYQFTDIISDSIIKIDNSKYFINSKKNNLEIFNIGYKEKILLDYIIKYNIKQQYFFPMYTTIPMLLSSGLRFITLNINMYQTIDVYYE